MVEHVGRRLNTKTHKYCPKCKKLKLRSKFGISRSARDGLQGYCRKCLRKRGRLDRLGHYNEADLVVIRKRAGKRCEICRKKKVLCVDHAHDTGKPRGLLCHECNLGLGKFEDSLELVTKAAEYLRIHDASHAI